MPANVLADLHILTWRSVSEFTEEATETYTVAMRSLQAVVKKLSIEDAKIDPITDYPALKRFLEE